MLEAMRKDKARFIPATGFNVIGVDDFEDPGEQLYLIGHYETEDQAKAALKEWQGRNPGEATHLYGPETK